MLDVLHSWIAARTGSALSALAGGRGSERARALCVSSPSCGCIGRLQNDEVVEVVPVEHRDAPEYSDHESDAGRNDAASEAQSEAPNAAPNAAPNTAPRAQGAQATADPVRRGRPANFAWPAATCAIGADANMGGAVPFWKSVRGGRSVDGHRPAAPDRVATASGRRRCSARAGTASGSYAAGCERVQSCWECVT